MVSKSQRIESIDFYRGIAVVSVLFFHYNGLLPYGYLGVDLFFVISGYLVGGILIKDYLKGNISILNFVLKRSFKILPSYYFFIIFGNIVAFIVYKNTNIDGYIPFKYLLRYLLFFRNYKGDPHYWNFDHVWSLCIEEHFYLATPLILFFLLKIFGVNNKMLFLLIIIMIISGFMFKNVSFFLTNSKETYHATHNRIDALGYGMLLNILPINSKFKNNKILFFVLILFFFTIILDKYTTNIYFKKIIFHSITPIFLSGIIYLTFNYNFNKFKFIKVISKYSYNLYLWHTVFVLAIHYYVGINIFGLFIYILISFLLAFFTTKYLEIPILKKREKAIAYIRNKAYKIKYVK